MRNDEIENFIKSHTQDFEMELRQKTRQVTNQPNPGYAITAAINLQQRCDFNQHVVIQQKWKAFADYIVMAMDNAEKITLVKILDFGRRLLNELEFDSVPYFAIKNMLFEIVEEYHLQEGIKTRACVQKILYAIADCPGDFITLSNLRTDISSRMERTHCNLGGKSWTLRYLLPLDDQHLDNNPPMRRISPITTSQKSTQTDGKFSAKPVLGLILQD